MTTQQIKPSMKRKMASDFRLLRFVASVIILATFSCIQADVLDKDDIKSPDILRELSEDPTLLPMNKGALFVPYLVDPKREAMFVIKQNGKVVKKGQLGQRIPLRPGIYTVELGDGPKNQKITETVTIQNERVSVIIPTWSALIIRTVDENQNTLKRSYQLGSETTRLILGTGMGADELKGERDKVWILKPDLYRIMRRGTSLDSTSDYVTVRTLPGKATYAYIVFNDKTGTVMGGGEISPETANAKKRGNWRLNLVLSGTFAFSYNGYVDTSQAANYSVSLGSRVTGTFVYDKQHFYWINRLEWYEQFQKPNDGKLLFDRDQLKIESSFIYRINDYIGPYISFRGDTSFFNHHEKVSDDSNVDTYREDSPAVVDENGNVITPADRTLLPKDSYFTYAKSLSPSRLIESTGLNFDYRADVIFFSTARIGWALQQLFAPYLYDIAKPSVFNYSTGRYTRVFPRKDDFNFDTGPEVYLILQFSPFSFIELKEEFEMLLPVTGNKSLKDNLIFSSISTATLWISSFASIMYEFTIDKNSAVSDKTEMKHFVTIQLFYKVL